MSDQQQMKAALQAYIDAFNRADVAAIVTLYAEDAVVEDPVGKAPIAGRAKIEAFYKAAVAGGAKLRLAAPIRGSHGKAAAMAFDVLLEHGALRGVIRVIDVMTFDEAGKFASMRAYWGPGDMEMAKPA